MSKRQNSKRAWTETRVERLLVRVFDLIMTTRWLRGTVYTFHDAGILTTNKGIVITTPDGREFQLSIVESTRVPFQD